MPNRQQTLVDLALKGGSDKDLILLDLIHNLEDKVAELQQKVDSGVLEVKNNTPVLEKVLKSVRGLPGPEGKQGPEGKAFIGSQGPEGKQGLQGPKGDRGDKGDSIVGPQGKPGKDSTVPGPRGPEGKQGKEGQGGAQATPIEIRDKLEILAGEERLDSSAIKGLPEEIKHITERTGRQAGWGAHPLTIQQDGLTMAKVARFINFVGATVTVSPNGVITVTITGGGPPVPTSDLILQDGSDILLQDGGTILLN